MPEEGHGYTREGDRIERKLRGDYDWKKDGEEEMVCVPMSLYKSLIYKAEQYDKMKQIADEKEAEGGGDQGGLPPLPRLDLDDGRKKGRSDRRDDDDNGGGGGAGEVGDPKDPTTRKK